MLIGHRELAAHQYAVVNPLQLKHTHSQWADLPTRELLPEELADKAGAMPRLLDLTELDPVQQSALLERVDDWDRVNDYPFFGLLLKSTSSPAGVARHLTRQLVARSPDGSDVLLRWYDPRVFRHLCWLFTPVQMRALSGPVNAWCWRDGPRHWRSLEVAAMGHVPGRLRPTVEQWTAIGRIGVLNRTIAQLERNVEGLAFDEALYRRVEMCLRSAYDQHGLTEEADARLFVEQAIRWPGMHRLPEVARRLTSAGLGEITYVGACVGLDLEAWTTFPRTANSNARTP